MIPAKEEQKDPRPYFRRQKLGYGQNDRIFVDRNLYTDRMTGFSSTETWTWTAGRGLYVQIAAYGHF